MEWLTRLFEHDLWANERVLACCRELSKEQLTAPVEGMFGSVAQTWAHLTAVQQAFGQLMGADVPAGDLPEDATDLHGIDTRLPAINAGFDRFTRSLDEAGLQRQFHVPWFGRDLSVGDGLLQVINHTTQHRTDLASAVTRFGVKPPALDFIFFRLGVEDDG